MTIKHRLAHRLGWNEGDVESWWAGKSLMVGFRCFGCGQLSDVHVSPFWAAAHLWSESAKEA